MKFSRSSIAAGFLSALYMFSIGELSAQPQTADISFSELTATFQSDRTYEKIAALNTVRASIYQQDTVSYLLDQYQEISRTLSSNSVDSDLLLAATLSNVLLQSRRNGFQVPDVAIDHIERFTFGILQSGDKNILLEAIVNLAIFDDMESANALVELIKTGEESVYRASVLSYSQLCESYDFQQFEKAISERSDSEISIALDIHREFFEFREQVSYCEGVQH